MQAARGVKVHVLSIYHSKLTLEEWVCFPVDFEVLPVSKYSCIVALQNPLIYRYQLCTECRTVMTIERGKRGFHNTFRIAVIIGSLIDQTGKYH